MRPRRTVAVWDSDLNFLCQPSGHIELQELFFFSHWFRYVLSMRAVGSLALCRSLLKASLVDRFRVVVFPVITGSSGRERIYDGYPDVALAMTSSRTFDGRIQLLEYVPTILTGIFFFFFFFSIPCTSFEYVLLIPLAAPVHRLSLTPSSACLSFPSDSLASRTASMSPSPELRPD